MQRAAALRKQIAAASSAGQDRIAKRRRHDPPCDSSSTRPVRRSDVVGPASVQETFSIAERLLERTRDHIGEDALLEALRGAQWRASSTFTGAGFAELAVQSLFAHGRRACPSMELHWGAAADINATSGSIAQKHSGTSRCIFGSVFDWVQGPLSDALLLEPPVVDCNCEAWCHAHSRQCRTPARKLQDALLDVEFAGPPCPPWSKMGKKHGIADPRFRIHQAWVATMR